MQTSTETLCRNFPPEFTTYLNYCKALGFEDRPDYAYLRRLFKDLFLREQFEYDFIFDWVLLNSMNHRNEKDEKKEDEKAFVMQRTRKEDEKEIFAPRARREEQKEYTAPRGRNK